MFDVLQSYEKLFDPDFLTHHRLKYARIQENTGQWKPTFSHILGCAFYVTSIFLYSLKTLGDQNSDGFVLMVKEEINGFEMG